MTKEQAYELAKKHIEGATTLCVLSDGSVFIDNDVDSMKKHAADTKKDIFVLKGEEKAEEPKVEAKKEAPKKVAKKKK